MNGGIGHAPAVGDLIARTQRTLHKAVDSHGDGPLTQVGSLATRTNVSARELDAVVQRVRSLLAADDLSSADLHALDGLVQNLEATVHWAANVGLQRWVPRNFARQRRTLTELTSILRQRYDSMRQRANALTQPVDNAPGALPAPPNTKKG